MLFRVNFELFMLGILKLAHSRYPIIQNVDKGPDVVLDLQWNDDAVGC